MRRLLPIAWAAVLLAALTVTATLMAQVASAHAARIAEDPADNAILTSSPSQVSATFNERLQTTFAAMTVVGPDANIWSADAPNVRGAVVAVGVRPLGPAGRYTVNYRVTSADGHVVSGSWSFGLTVPGTGTPGPAAAASDEGGDIPTWPFAVGAIIAVGVGALWAIRRRP
ncbi:Copper transport protein YcnJ [Mycobacterium simulans]|uniref:Copper transport protein YcnJ n=1 Tax=Mycobacterium simulans TaxID=627089 RepID=A0A7Z7IT34_9MYCO|nr:copper resistance CopC family protein [Mycobacterium simulans]SOJ58029.1 Copper transport protein YcnJ [Mycobacterium simulans]